MTIVPITDSNSPITDNRLAITDNRLPITVISCVWNWTANQDQVLDPRPLVHPSVNQSINRSINQPINRWTGNRQPIKPPDSRIQLNLWVYRWNCRVKLVSPLGTCHLWHVQCVLLWYWYINHCIVCPATPSTHFPFLNGFLFKKFKIGGNKALGSWSLVLVPWGFY